MKIYLGIIVALIYFFALVNSNCAILLKANKNNYFSFFERGASKYFFATSSTRDTAVNVKLSEVVWYKNFVRYLDSMGYLSQNYLVLNNILDFELFWTRDTTINCSSFTFEIIFINKAGDNRNRLVYYKNNKLIDTIFENSNLSNYLDILFNEKYYKSKNWNEVNYFGFVTHYDILLQIKIKNKIFKLNFNHFWRNRNSIYNTNFNYKYTDYKSYKNYNRFRLFYDNLYYLLVFLSEFDILSKDYWNCFVD